MEKVIEFDEKCKSCDGTGLYVGMAEQHGASVVCSTCKGTGKHHFKYEYEDFEGRKEREGVKRVYQTNPWIMIGEKGGVCKLTDFGGMSYEKWKNGNSFEIGMEDRQHTCPAWFYQSADYKKKPKWDICIAIGSFSACDNFKNKEACWERFDKENKK